MPLCGICKAERERGSYFHAFSECMHRRMFICRDCGETIPMQRSYHELCYECTGPISDEQIAGAEGMAIPQVVTLGQKIQGFERSHAALFEVLPCTVGIDDVHPGSLSPNLREWRERHGF